MPFRITLRYCDFTTIRNYVTRKIVLFVDGTTTGFYRAGSVIEEDNDDGDGKRERNREKESNFCISRKLGRAFT